MAEKRPDRTLGMHHDTFWEWCGKGELRIQRCSACGHLNWPVMQKCESCGTREFAWEKMSGRGKVVSGGSFHMDYYHGLLPVPYDCILVELDEGPLFMSNPKGFAWTEATFEMPVKVAFAECEDSAGGFKLPVFERA